MQPPSSLIKERERVETPKRRISVGKKLAVLFRFAKCSRCGERLFKTGIEYDHEIPLALGGKDDPDNMVPLCPPCHSAKTKNDQKVIAKTKRLQGVTGRHNPNRKTKKIQSKGFDKSLSRSFDGTIRRRIKREK